MKIILVFFPRCELDCGENALSRNAEKFFKKLVDSEADDCQKIISSSLSIISGKISMKVRSVVHTRSC